MRLSGINMELVNHEDKFQQLSRPPIIVNKSFDIRSEVDRKKLNNLLITEYDGEVLSPVPECVCGFLHGGEREGEICPECNTACMQVTERPIESFLWVEVPEGIDTFISPAAWRKLDKLLKLPGFSTLNWLTDSTYKYTPQGDNPNDSVTKFIDMGYPRGLNEFYRNFDDIIKSIIENNLLKPGIKKRNTLVERWLEQCRDRIFTRYLPIPSKLVFIVEKPPGGKTSYADLKMTKCLDALRTLASIDTSYFGVNDRVKNSRTVKSIKQLASFYHDFYKVNLISKKGWFRKAIYGSRLDFTARAVISSIHRVHRYDEIELPWGLSVDLYRLHLTSKLLKLGYAPIEINNRLSQAVKQFDPLISELFDELINETKHGYLTGILQRNPSLERLSGQKFKIPKIRRDPEINAIGLPVTSASAPNADQLAFL